MTSKIFCKTRLASTRTRDWNFFGEFSAGIDFPMSLKVDSTVEHLEYLWFHSRGIIERILQRIRHAWIWNYYYYYYEKRERIASYIFIKAAREIQCSKILFVRYVKMRIIFMFVNSDKFVITLMIFTRTRCACFNCTIFTVEDSASGPFARNLRIRKLKLQVIISLDYLFTMQYLEMTQNNLKFRKILLQPSQLNF